MHFTPRKARLTVAAALTAVLGLASPAWAVPSSTTVTASPQSTTVNNPVQLLATVDCPADPTGGLGVTFFDGGDLLDTVAVNANGQAGYTATFTTAGTTPGFCLLACGGLIDFSVGDITNNINTSGYRDRSLARWQHR
ncbi:hypothetical protein [Streptomyces seoulensis]|uniref:hypothetical protein n=1 Tax=Streptomyces seoulensis TaxID=73044 RepID=UPI00068F3807|nr:hypothetical protein [Streptomyces seoulensis]